MHGEDKGLMHWQGKPMIEHIISQLGLPSEKLIISANRNIDIYQQYAKQVVDDNDVFLPDEFQGPLVGILSAMKICPTPYLLCLPCDTPAPPENLLMHLYLCMQRKNKTDAICHDGERLQPLFSLLNCQHRLLLENFLQQGRRKVHDFIDLIDPAICDFSTQKNRFHNFNRPDDMK